MWELDYKESWALKNWCFWTVVMEKTLESPLDCKEIKPVYPKGNQSWIFFARSEDEAETPILWPPDMKNWLIGKDPDAGKDRRLEEKGTQGMSLLDGITYSIDMSLNKLLVINREAWCAAVHGLQRVGHDGVTEWTEDFRTVMLQRLLRVFWAARDQTSWSWRKSTFKFKYSFKGLMLKLKLQYFGHLMQRASSLEKTLIPGNTEGKGEEGGRGWDDYIASPTQCTWIRVNPGRWWRAGEPGVLQSMGSQKVRHNLRTEQQQSEDSGQATQNWLQDESQQIAARKPLIKRPSRANPGHNMSFLSHPINCQQRSLSVIYAPNALWGRGLPHIISFPWK